MYSIHRLSRINQDYVFSFSGSARAKSDAFSFALAAMLVNSISFVKTEGVTLINPLEHRDNLIQSFNNVNEILRIDIDKVLEYAQKLYNYRSSMLNTQESPRPILSQETSVMDFFGITMYFSKEDLSLIMENANQIATDTLSLQSLLKELGVIEQWYQGKS